MKLAKTMKSKLKIWRDSSLTAIIAGLSKFQVYAFREQIKKDDNGQVVSMGSFDSDTLPVMHQGRKIQVMLRPAWVPDSKKTALILSVSDQTHEALD